MPTPKGWGLGIHNRIADVDICEAHAYTDALAALDPAAWWPLNEGAGTVAADVTGNGHNGVYQTGVHLAEHPGPCDIERYVGIPRNGSLPAVKVPDFSAVSYPNQFTIVTSTYFANALIGSGTSIAGMVIAYKATEWYLNSGSQNIDFVQMSNGDDGGGFNIYREYFIPTVTSTVIGGGWHLVITQMKSTDIEVRIDSDDNIDPTTHSGAHTGPAGTRKGNTSSELWLGLPVGNMTSPADVTHGRWLANVAVFDRLLDSTERAGLWTAYDADGWI